MVHLSPLPHLTLERLCFFLFRHCGSRSLTHSLVEIYLTHLHFKWKWILRVVNLVTLSRKPMEIRECACGFYLCHLNLFASHHCASECTLRTCYATHIYMCVFTANYIIEFLTSVSHHTFHMDAGECVYFLLLLRMCIWFLMPASYATCMFEMWSSISNNSETRTE